MSRKIIILERTDEPSDLNFNYVFWADVPTARNALFSDQTKTSAVKDATAPELTAIKNGQILEFVGRANYIAGTTTAQIKADLVTRFTAYQAQVNLRNPYLYYGTYYDGTSWTNGGVA